MIQELKLKYIVLSNDIIPVKNIRYIQRRFPSGTTIFLKGDKCVDTNETLEYLVKLLSNFPKGKPND